MERLVDGFGLFSTTLPSDVLDEVRALVTCGFDNRERVFFRIVETMAEELGWDLDAMHAHSADHADASQLRTAIEAAFAQKESELAT